MAAITRKVLAGLVQMTSVNDVAVNFRSCSQLVADAVGRGCEIIFFPECFSFIGAAAGEAQRAAEPLTGPVMQRYLDLAKQHEVWLSLGGFQERVEGEVRQGRDERRQERAAGAERAAPARGRSASSGCITRKIISHAGLPAKRISPI